MNKLGDHPGISRKTAALLLCAGLAGPVWSAPSLGCGTLSIDRLIAQSLKVKQAQVHLLQELAPRVADLTTRHSRIRQLELALHTAPPSEASVQRAELESELVSNQASFAMDKAAYQADKERRMREVFAGLMEEVTSVYRAIGSQRGFSRLYQDGVPEPIVPPFAEALEVPCAESVDVTDEVVKAFDSGLQAHPN